jgi:hypothetical protein
MSNRFWIRIHYLCIFISINLLKMNILLIKKIQTSFHFTVTDYRTVYIYRLVLFLGDFLLLLDILVRPPSGCGFGSETLPKIFAFFKWLRYWYMQPVTYLLSKLIFLHHKVRVEIKPGQCGGSIFIEFESWSKSRLYENPSPDPDPGF